MVGGFYGTGGICRLGRRLCRRNLGGGIGGGRRGPLRSEALMHALVVEAVRALDALLGAGDVLLLQLLEVGHARHDVMALRGVAAFVFSSRHCACSWSLASSSSAFHVAYIPAWAAKSVMKMNL